MESNLYCEKIFETAEGLWDSLSPTNELVAPPCKLIYRGQENAKWQLIPSILRDETRNKFGKYWSKKLFEDQIHLELFLLRRYVEYCDDIGIRIPNDSLKFRSKNLEISKQDRYYLNLKKWPNPKLLELMAFAQHHGIPTRLLDWTKNPYAAVYFCASSALSNVREPKEDQMLAIWVLNIEMIHLYPKVKVIHPPGSISHHLAAQSGLFTVQFHEGSRGKPFDIADLETDFSLLPINPLTKLTIPVAESIRLLELCAKIGLSAARMFPGADGAGRAVMDGINLWAARNN